MGDTLPLPSSDVLQSRLSALMDDRVVQCVEDNGRSMLLELQRALDAVEAGDSLTMYLPLLFSSCVCMRADTPPLSSPPPLSRLSLCLPLSFFLSSP